MCVLSGINTKSSIFTGLKFELQFLFQGSGWIIKKSVIPQKHPLQFGKVHFYFRGWTFLWQMGLVTRMARTQLVGATWETSIKKVHGQGLSPIPPTSDEPVQRTRHAHSYTRTSSRKTGRSGRSIQSRMRAIRRNKIGFQKKNWKRHWQKGTTRLKKQNSRR